MKRIAWCILALLVCERCLAASPATAPAYPPDAPVLRNVRWQELDERLRDAVGGLDGRVWFCYPPPPDPDAGGDCIVERDYHEQARREVEAQWRDATPRLIYCKPTFFEPGGRVWFTSNSWLLAYDGREWLERKNPNRYIMEPSVCRAGDATFLCEHDGISVRHGGKGEWKKLDADYPGLCVMPGTDGAFAWSVSLRKAWWCRKGEWRRVPMPRDFAAAYDNTAKGGRAYYSYVLAAPGGQIWLQRDRRIEVIDLAPADAGAAKTIRDMIGKLGDDKYAVRNRATKDLVAIGTPAWSMLLDTLESTADPEVRTRVTRILDTVEFSQSRPMRTIGPYRVGKVSRVWQSPEGLVFVASEEIARDGKNPAPGMIIVEPSGRAHLLNGYDYATRVNIPMLLAGGKTVYMNFAGELHPSVRVDIRGDGIKARELDNSMYNRVRAVAADGTLYVSWSSQSGPLLAYRPDAPDDRPALDGREIPLEKYCYYGVCVADDGAIWAVPEGKGLARFDGKIWRTILPTPFLREPKFPWAANQLSILTPLRNGTVLAQLGDRSFVLAGAGEVVKAESLTELAANHRKAVQAAFADHAEEGAFQYFDNIASGLTVDRKGDIWVVENAGITVLPAGSDKWVKVELPKWADPKRVTLYSPHEAGEATVLVRAHQTMDFEGSLLVSLRDGQCKVSQLPQAPAVYLRDGLGTLWVPTAVRDKTGDTHSGYRSAVLLMDDKGARTALEDCTLLAADKSGEIWVRNWNLPLRDNRIVAQRVRRDGKVSARMLCGTPGFCESPTSWWVRSDLGLVHATLAPGRTDFQMSEPYRVQVNARWTPAGVGGVTRDYLVGNVRRWDASARADRYFLVLIERPKN